VRCMPDGLVQPERSLAARFDDEHVDPRNNLALKRPALKQPCPETTV
jgi:hypothetical protein